MDAFPPLVGVDFSSAPSRRKPIVRAFGLRHGDAVHLQQLDALPSLAAYAEWAAEPGEWLGGFDLPFGLPRELVTALGWPTDWRALMAHYASLSRDEIRRCFAAFCAARPAGGKFAHRACDAPAGSSPSMKWVNPPVAFMLHAGVPPLLAGGVGLPAVGIAGDGRRVALEAYPGLLARETLGRRSYKRDDAKGLDPARRRARADLVQALCEGRTRLALRLVVDAAQREQLVEQGSADRLDAVLCLMQAAWAAGQPGYGLPAEADPLEGWITSA